MILLSKFGEVLISESVARSVELLRKFYARQDPFGGNLAVRGTYGHVCPSRTWKSGYR